ncbi:MAG: 1-acyl-sn-glycerol-3-phosphate acyltransferase [Deltaproteobacteria bacterium]|nr:1-acyl-sn-glycerol-3-phosphate acyltransferase [Deltaproteobacteria bacterium]
MRAEDKQRVLAEVTQRVLDNWSEDPEQAIFDTIYHERQRLEKERNQKLRKSWSGFYDGVAKEALKADTVRQRELLRAIIRRFADEVVGHFDPKVYQLATRVLPPALNLMFNAMSPLKLLQALPNGLTRLDNQLIVTGETEVLKKVAKLGTTVLVPTHSSNLDSILVGFGLHRLGLPPYVYGAGLNLFANKLMGFFMHNLGAYKVDRRKQAPIYKNVLKTYAGHSMEMGYHNLFFPGGTRSRSGSVEQKLKLGLLGMAGNAYIHNLRAKIEKPDIFVVPCTINYQLVLEAETLISDHLKDVGKSRYIIEDDEFSRPKRILDFVDRMFSMHSTIHIVISRPMDVFGNPVDDEGRSIDARGRTVDRERYIQNAAGLPDLEPQRDQEYTKELSTAVAHAYKRDTMFKPIHLVSRTVFSLLKELNPDMDLYRLLRTGGEHDHVPLTQVYHRLERSIDQMARAKSAGRLWLDPVLAAGDPVEIMSHALKHLSTYHHHPALVRRGDRLFHEDRNLLLFYQNRFAGHDVAV